MKKDTFINAYVGKQVLDADIKEREAHKSSGKLSASALGQPLQWQILHCLGVEQKPFEEYTLRKFIRGKAVERWLLDIMPNVIEEQRFAGYRNCVGFIDAIVDTKKWDFPSGIIPVEIKSVSNAKFKRILRNGADRSHKLQAGYYALCEETSRYAVIYVSTDDMRIETYIYETADIKDEIDSIITRFDKQWKIGVPVFVPEEKWQENPKYNNYPNFSDLTQEEIDNYNKKLKVGNKQK